jgi:hypothetical protein
MYRANSALEFDTRVKILTDHGVAMPPDFDGLRRRLGDFADMAESHPIRDRLVDTIVGDGPTKNTGAAQLYAMAIAEALDPGYATPVRQAVYDAAHNKLVELASAAAPAIYAQISAEWDDLADEFTGHAKVTDLEASADDAHQLPEPERQAWLLGEQAAHQLERLLPVLRAAGELVGLPLDDDQGIPDEAALFALCAQIDTTVHRRRAWEAWAAHGRCSRWNALLALDGVTIKAANPDAPFTAYPRPRPTEIVKEPIHGQPRGYYNTVIRDPEDDGKPVFVAEPFDPIRKTGSKATLA